MQARGRLAPLNFELYPLDYGIFLGRSKANSRKLSFASDIVASNVVIRVLMVMRRILKYLIELPPILRKRTHGTERFTPREMSLKYEKALREAVFGQFGGA